MYNKVKFSSISFSCRVNEAEKMVIDQQIIKAGCSATYWIKNALWNDIPIDILISNIDKEYLKLPCRRQIKKQSFLASISSGPDRT